MCHYLSRFIIMGRIFSELLVMGCFLWCIALLCPMDRAFLARRLIVPAGFLIVSVDSLIVSGRGIRGRERVIVLSNKNTVFLLRGGKGMRIWRILRIERIWRKVGREHELGEFYELSEFSFFIIRSHSPKIRRPQLSLKNS